MSGRQEVVPLSRMHVCHFRLLIEACRKDSEHANVGTGARQPAREPVRTHCGKARLQMLLLILVFR